MNETFSSPILSSLSILFLSIVSLLYHLLYNRVIFYKEAMTGESEKITGISNAKRQYAYVSTGSYHDYYKRNVDGHNRLDYFEKEWFTNKRCLDVGCNEGLLTNRKISPTYRA